MSEIFINLSAFHLDMEQVLPRQEHGRSRWPACIPFMVGF